MKNFIIVLAIAGLTASNFLMISCGDKEEEELIHNVTLDTYSEQGKCILHYIDKNSQWQEIEINSNTFSISIEQVESNYDYSIRLESESPDSLYLKASADGKSIDHAYRTTGTGTMTLSVELTQLK